MRRPCVGAAVEVDGAKSRKECEARIKNKELKGGVFQSDLIICFKNNYVLMNIVSKELINSNEKYNSPHREANISASSLDR